MASFFDLVASLQASIDDLDLILSGGDSETVNVNGVNKDSISKAIKDKFSALSSMMQGRLSFATNANMTEDTSQPSNKLAEVWNDSVPGNNGLYGWTGTQWLKSTYSIKSVIDSENETVAVNGAAVRRYVDVVTVASVTPNLLDYENALADHYIEANGVVEFSVKYKASDYIQVDEGVTYKIYKNSGASIVSGTSRKSCYYDENFNVIVGGSVDTISQFTVPIGVKYVRLSPFVVDAEFQITLVNSNIHTSPVASPYYPVFKKGVTKSAVDKVYAAVVENELGTDDAVPSKGTVQRLISESIPSPFVAVNSIVNGDHLLGDPETRSGSPSVDLTTQSDLIARGYTRALSWRTSSDFIRSTINAAIVGKYVTSGYLCYSENPADLVSSSTIYSEDATGGISALDATTYAGLVVLSSRLVYVYRQALISQATAVNTLTGSAVGPAQSNSRFCTGFISCVTDEPIAESAFVDFIFTNDKTRVAARLQAQAVTLAIVKKRALLELGGQGGTTTITGTKYIRKVSPFKFQSIATSNVFNFDADYIGVSPIMLNTTDDVAPVHANGSTLLANHSYKGCKYTAAAHGKLDADIGSIYSSEGNQYVLTNIVNTDTLWVADTLSNGDTYPINLSLVYVSGGVSTANIAVTTKSVDQMYPCYADYEMTVVVDGVIVDDYNSTMYFENNVTFNESYGLLKREDIIAWYITSGNASLNVGGPVALLQTVAYQFDWEGNCTISADYTCFDSLLIADIMALQAAPSISNYYYIPKTIEFTHDSAQLNFSMIEPSDVVSTGGGTSVYFYANRLDASAIPSDRWLQIGDYGVFAMGFLPVGSAGVNRSENVTDKTMEIRGNTNKMYPRLLDVNDFTAVKGDSWGCVAYRNIHKPHSGATANYPVRTSGDDYYYIDYHNTNELVSIPMPEDFVGREFEIVESRNITAVSKVISHKFNCLVNCVGDYGYLVLRVKK